MKESDLLHILLVIKNNGDSYFTERVLGYYETAVLLSQAEKEGLIIESDAGYKLTPAGNECINRINKWIGRTGIDKCIVPYTGARIIGNGTDAVYLPKK